jgi:uncharacterized protein
MTPAEPPAGLPPFLGELIGYLRRRRIQIGVDDILDLRASLRAGLGLGSTRELREVCVALWAASPAEAKIIRAAFATLAGIPQWRADTPRAGGGAPAPPSGEPATHPQHDDASLSGEQAEGEDEWDDAAQAGNVRTSDSGPGPLRTGTADPRLLLVPQYPLAAREVAQAWRHLRRPVRTGPAVELDITASIRDRARRGVATPPVLVPRRRNAVRLLLLIDRNGSMTPFHQYVDFVVAGIRDASRIDDVLPVYFHDVPGPHADRAVLGEDPFRADLDPVLSRIGPLRDGRVYADPGLARPMGLPGVLEMVTPVTAVLVISDGGAARGKLDNPRLLDTVALLKAVRLNGAGTGWLNPVPSARWTGTTAAAVARHVPMYPFTRQGLDTVVDVLRGRPASVERPA